MLHQTTNTQIQTSMVSVINIAYVSVRRSSRLSHLSRRRHVRLQSCAGLPRAVAPVAVHGASHWVAQKQTKKQNKNKNKEENGRTEEKGQEEEEEGVRRSEKQGKKEKPKKRRELKNIATGCWVTLESDGGDGADDGEMKSTWNCLSCHVPFFSPPLPR